MGSKRGREQGSVTKNNYQPIIFTNRKRPVLHCNIMGINTFKGSVHLNFQKNILSHLLLMIQFWFYLVRFQTPTWYNRDEFNFIHGAHSRPIQKNHIKNIHGSVLFAQWLQWAPVGLWPGTFCCMSHPALSLLVSRPSLHSCFIKRGGKIVLKNKIQQQHLFLWQKAPLIKINK